MCLSRACLLRCGLPASLRPASCGLRACLRPASPCIATSHLLLDDRKQRGPTCKEGTSESCPAEGQARRESGTMRWDANAAKHPRNTTRPIRYASTVEMQRSFSGTFSGIRRQYVSSRILRMCQTHLAHRMWACVPQRQGSAYNAKQHYLHTLAPVGYAWPKFSEAN